MINIDKTIKERALKAKRKISIESQIQFDLPKLTRKGLRMFCSNYKVKYRWYLPKWYLKKLILKKLK